MKAILIARISDREQEEGHSIAAQTRKGKEYCERNGLNLVAAYEFTESSTRGDRKKFQEIITLIRRSKQKCALVADAVDRVQRSFKESIVLDELRLKEKLEMHFIREGIVLTKDSKSMDILRWDYAVMGAKTYVLNISENVKRSIDYKISKGEWPGAAPIGYLNVKNSKEGDRTIIIDPVRGTLVRDLFEMYATGTYSITQLAKTMKDLGLRSRLKDKPISKSQIHNILKNPFYSGTMKFRGELHKHKYEPLISRCLFQQCQNVRESFRKTPFSYAAKPYLFRGLLKCGHCGCRITTDTKKKKYTYLNCTQSNGRCGSKRVREDQILKQVEDIFRTLRIPAHVLEEVEQSLKTSLEAKKAFKNSFVEDLQREYREQQNRLDTLLEVRLEKSISRDEYNRKANQIKERLLELEVSISQHRRGDEDFATTLNYLLDLASRALDLFQKSSVDQKRHLLKFVLSNSKLISGKLVYTLRKPFDTLVESSKCSKWLPLLGACRTGELKIDEFLYIEKPLILQLLNA